MLWKFRWYSVINQALIWLTVALVFGAVLERFPLRTGNRASSRAGARGVRPALSAPVLVTQWDDGLVLGDLAALGPFFALSSHPAGEAPVPPWRPVSELTAPSGALRDRISAVRAALAARGGLAASDIEQRVAASAVHLSLVARLTAPALGAAVLCCPVDMRPGGLWWQDGPGGPVPLSVLVPAGGSESREHAPGARPRPMAEEWERLLFSELLAPVTAAIALLVPVSGRVLWGNVASAVNAAAAQVARQRPDLAASAWQAAGRLFGQPWLRGEPNPPGPVFRRSSCCLFYRLALSYQQAQGNPPAVCGDCVLAGRWSSR